MAQVWTTIRILQETLDWLTREAGRRTATTGKRCSAAEVNEEAVAAYREKVETASPADAVVAAYVEEPVNA